MWDKLWDYGKQILSLSRDMQQSKEDIKAVREERKEDRQEIKELNQKVERLTEIVQHLAFELQRQRDKAETERKMHLLEIENMMLRYGRSLPPPQHKSDDTSDTDE